ncbi:MAG: NTP transferase domain-containing protein, partial [Candidatus Nealsonbacteria bacterium]|nr:NTP transferase domain-containing protein [Candidatus Nealsonbacteria bacterium]
MTKPLKAIILAAGESSRFWPLNREHKSLTQIAGQPLIAHTIKSLEEKGICHTVVIQGAHKDIEEALGERQGVSYLVQPKATGMGDAIAMAQGAEASLVFNAHRVDAGGDSQKIMEKAETSGAGLILQGAETNQPQLYGIAEFEGDRVKGVVEKPAPENAPSNVRVVGSYLLPPDFPEYHKKAAAGHYSFEEALNLYVKEKDARIVMAGTSGHSLKYPWQLFEIVKYLLDANLKGQE